jgi:hypothetical protein
MIDISTHSKKSKCIAGFPFAEILNNSHALAMSDPSRTVGTLGDSGRSTGDKIHQHPTVCS